MGKIIRVTPEELRATSAKLADLSGEYTSVYNKLMQDASTMGAAWEGEDNQAFVQQISGFTEELKQMADKILAASEGLKMQADNYSARQDDNIAVVKTLPN